jgi:hypothetical protein
MDLSREDFDNAQVHAAQNPSTWGYFHGSYTHRMMFIHTEQMQDLLTTITRAGTLFLLIRAVLSLLATMPVCTTPNFRYVISMLTTI